jgi:hypothetical protein
MMDPHSLVYKKDADDYIIYVVQNQTGLAGICDLEYQATSFHSYIYFIQDYWTARSEMHIPWTFIEMRVDTSFWQLMAHCVTVSRETIIHITIALFA